MDLRQLENIIAIEREHSISRAAESLFLTQSALNQQLLKLEKELGTPLFERRRHTMVPTFAGQTYLAAAHQILDLKQQTYRTIHDISNEESGEIAIAYTPETGSRMFSAIYPVFHERYPNVTFRIREERVKKMEQLLVQKEVTFAHLSYYESCRHPDLEYLDIREEYMVLGLPKSHPLAYLGGPESWRTLPLLDLTLLRHQPFVILNKETRMRDMIDSAFTHAGFRPQVLFESISTHTVVSMVQKQIAPAFSPSLT